jgi:flagellin-like protein
LKGEKGVSPVVGTILLIAVTVALAAVVATLVGGLGGGAVPPTPTLSITAQENADGQRINLTIAHGGGDALTLSDIELIAEDENAEDTTQGTLGSGTLSVGHSITVSYPYTDAAITTPVPVGEMISVKLIHTPSSQQIYDLDVLVAA